MAEQQASEVFAELLSGEFDQVHEEEAEDEDEARDEAEDEAEDEDDA